MDYDANPLSRFGQATSFSGMSKNELEAHSTDNLTADCCLSIVAERNCSWDMEVEGENNYTVSFWRVSNDRTLSELYLVYEKG